MSTNLEAPANDPLGTPLIAAPETGLVRPRRRLPAQALTMLVVLCVSVGALWAMRRYGMRAGMSFASGATDVPANDADKARTYDRIMADLARIQQPLDVALGEFTKSPFMLDARPAISAGGAETETDAQRAMRDREQRRQELTTRVEAFILHSIVGGRVAVARIDDKTVRVGDTLDQDFKVESIEGRSVVLSADGMAFTLSMTDDNSSRGKRSPVKMGGPGKRK